MPLGFEAPPLRVMLRNNQLIKYLPTSPLIRQTLKYHKCLRLLQATTTTPPATARKVNVAPMIPSLPSK